MFCNIILKSCFCYLLNLVSTYKYYIKLSLKYRDHILECWDTFSNRNIFVIDSIRSIPVWIGFKEQHVAIGLQSESFLNSTFLNLWLYSIFKYSAGLQKRAMIDPSLSICLGSKQGKCDSAGLQYIAMHYEEKKYLLDFLSK